MVFGAMGDASVNSGFSGLGVLERGTSMLEGAAMVDCMFPLSPDFEGFRITVPEVRPGTSAAPIGSICDFKGLFDRRSWLGPKLEPGRLTDCRVRVGWELSGRRLDPGRSPHLLTGLDVDPNGAASKKLELEALLLKEGVEGSCASVSIVLSAKEVGGLSAAPRPVSSPVESASMGLRCEGERAGAPTPDMLVMLGVRFLVMLACEIHCEDGLFLKPGSLVDGCLSPGPPCSVRVPKSSRGGRAELLLFPALGSLGTVLEVGRIEIGRGLARVLAVDGVVTAGLVLVLLVGGAFELLFVEEAGPGAKRSLEAAGRNRMLLPSADFPPFPVKLSIDGEGRRAVVLGMGKRDIGRGRPLPLGLPGGALFSSIVSPFC